MNPMGYNSKPVKFNIPGHAHELTFSCFRRMPLLKSRLANEFLADSVNAARIIHNFEVWAYVFMPEHVHLMIYPIDEDYSISDITKSIKQSASRKIINYCRENKPHLLLRLETGLKSPRYRFWQDGTGYDRNYYDPKEIRKQMEYIHNNPVKRGLVDSVVEWKWSSASYWIEDGFSPVKIKRDHFSM
jgi:putative transposase